MFAMLFAAAALAQGAPAAVAAPALKTEISAPGPERTVLARRLFVAMGAQDSLHSAADAMTKALFDQLADRDDFEKAWRAPAEDAAREAVAAIEPKIMDRWVALWARDLSEADLKAAIAFYESPVAAKINGASAGHQAELKDIIADLEPVIDRDAAARFCQKTTACIWADGI